MKHLTAADRSRPIAIWLLIGVVMIIIQIVLGGITRLTDSGLSITEWKPILGAIPPLSQNDWEAAFERYQQIAQYKSLHAYFTLDDFKSIYFWEWLHRLWGRLIGVVFAIPFVIFLLQRRFTAAMVQPMIILFLLGALQGLIGWIMVMSGLNDENLYVSHIRLAIHFSLALLLLVYTFWFAMQLLVKVRVTALQPSLRLLGVIIALLTVQLVYGAFMAGLKAAAAAPTWPDINGALVPQNLQAYGSRQFTAFSTLVNNPVTIHLIHRTLGYILVILIGWWTVRIWLRAVMQGWVKWLPVLLVVLQVVLGISTVLTSTVRQPRGWGIFEWNALLHQFVAMFLLLSLVLHYFLLRGRKN